MITYQIKAGTTDVSVVIRIVDSGDGTPETGVVFNTSGIDLEYRREGATSTDITEATLAGLNSAHADGGFLHIGNGYYRLDLPDAACASGVSGVLVHGTVTGMVVIGCYIQLIANTAEDVYSRVGAPAGASIAADIAAIEAQTDDIGAAGAGLTAIPWNAAWDAQVESEVADALAVYDPPTNAELVSEINSVQADIAALNDLDAAGVRAAVGLASANLDTQLAALPTAAEINAEVDTAISDAALATAADLATVDGNVDAIKAKTDSLTFTVAGQVDSNVQYVNDAAVTGDGQAGTEWGPA
jgi:hypothetical protein